MILQPPWTTETTTEGNPVEFPDGGIGVPVLEHGQTGIMGDIATLVIAMEELHHRKGWDETPPHLYQICHDVDGAGYAVYSAPLGLHDCSPAVELMALSLAMRDAPFGQEIMGINGKHPPVAHGVVMEAWSRVESEEEYAANANSPLGIADLPGSVELRCAYAVAGKYMLMVNRQRGHAPMFTRFDLDDPKSTLWGGVMLTGLLAFDSAAHDAYAAVN